MHVLDTAREAKIGDDDPTVLATQHVVRLEIAMDERRRMRGREPTTCLEERLDDREHRARLRRQPLGEGRAIDQLHRDVIAVARGPDLVHDHDILVGEPRHRAGLAQEPLARIATNLGRPQDLQCDVALEIRIERGMHHTHAALAEHALEPVATQGRAELRRRRSRRTGSGGGVRQLFIGGRHRRRMIPVTFRRIRRIPCV